MTDHSAINAPLILGMRVDPTSYVAATDLISGWAARHEHRYVCVANVHMVMESYDSAEFRQIVNNADLVTPDGMPLVWMLRRLGYLHQERVYGPQLMLHLLSEAEDKGLRVGFYGASKKTLQKMLIMLRKRFPALHVVYAYSPPFRSLSREEEDEVLQEMRIAAVQLLFVALGCPRQERWMARHTASVPSVMVGVGAAFDFIAGQKPQAPAWMQRLGLEWAFRLLTEPRRLWRRYLYNNPRFLLLAAKQLLGRNT